MSGAVRKGSGNEGTGVSSGSSGSSGASLGASGAARKQGAKHETPSRGRAPKRERASQRGSAAKREPAARDRTKPLGAFENDDLGPLTERQRRDYHDLLHIGITAEEMVSDFTLMLLYLTGHREGGRTDGAADGVAGCTADGAADGQADGSAGRRAGGPDGSVGVLRSDKAYPREVLRRFAEDGYLITSDSMRQAYLTSDGEAQAALLISVYKFLQDCMLDGVAQKVTGTGFMDNDPHELDWMK